MADRGVPNPESRVPLASLKPREERVGLTLVVPCYNEAAAFEQPFRSRWIFDDELLARYLGQPVGPGEPPRRARIYELALPAWHHVPGSKLRWTDYFRSFFDLAVIHHRYRR